MKEAKSKKCTSSTSNKETLSKSSTKKKISFLKKLKDKATKKIALIIFLMVLGISTAYAYYRIVTSDSGTLAGINASLECMDIEFSEENPISLENQYPITDEYALANLTPVIVKVTNKCTVGSSVNYTLALTTLKNATGFIEDNAIRTYAKRNLNNNGEKEYISARYLNSLGTMQSGRVYNYLTQELNKRNDTKNYTNKTIYNIDTRNLESGETNVYKLYLWIDYWEGDTTHTGLNNNTTQGLDFKNIISLVTNGNDSQYTVAYNEIMPNEYQEVEYIQSNGNQYILTDVIPTNSNGVYLKMINKDSSTNLVYFGSGTSNDDGFWIGNSGGHIYARFDTFYSKTKNNVLGSADISNNIMYEFKLNFLNDRKVVLGSTTLVENLSILNSKSLPLAIFGYNNPDDNIVHIPAKYQLYEFKISDNDEIIRNYIPCYRKSDGVIGLYEMVTKKFYTNDGTGSFEKGEDVQNGYHESKIQHFVVGTAQHLLTNEVTRGDLEFKGWNTKEDGSGTSYESGELVKDLTKENGTVINLYADWPEIYTVSYVNIEGNYPTSVVEGYSLNIDFNSTPYGVLRVLENEKTMSILIDYTYDDMILNIPEVNGNIKVISTGNVCMDNNIDNLGNCLLAIDQYTANIATAKSGIASKGTPDFSKPEPQVEYEKYIAYGVTSNNITSTSHPNITFSTTEPEFNTSTGYYTLLNTFTGKTTDYISDDDTKYYTCFSTATTCLNVYAVYSTRTAVNANTGTETYYLTKADRYTKKATDSSISNPGLYKDVDNYGDTYYYRGDVRNNWVSFGGFMWRVIRINGDGSIRMIFQGSANSTTHTGPSATIGSAFYGGTRSSFTTETDDISGLTNDKITTSYYGGRRGGTYVGYMFNPDIPISTYPDIEVSSTNKLTKFPSYTTVATTKYYFFKNFNRDTDCFLGDATKEDGACTLKCRKLGTDGEEGIDCVESTWNDLTNKEGNTSSSGIGTTSARLLFTSDYKYTCWATSTAVEKVNSDGTTSVYVTCPIVSEILGKNPTNTNIAYGRYHGLFHTNSTDANRNVMDTEIKSKVDTWYQSNILNKTDGTKYLEDYLSDEIFCNDRTYDSGTYPLKNGYTTNYLSSNTRSNSNTPSFKCLNIDGTFNTNDSFTLKTSGTNSTVASSGIGNKALTYPIGLPTIDEIQFAGMETGFANTKTYLHADVSIPTMSPAYIGSSLAPVTYYYNANGITAASGISTNVYVRPVINLNPNVLVSGGIGTESNPFTVSLPNN